MGHSPNIKERGEVFIVSEHCRLCFFILENMKDNMVKESDKEGKNESRRVHNEQDKGKATRVSNFPSSTT